MAKNKIDANGNLCFKCEKGKRLQGLSLCEKCYIVEKKKQQKKYY